MLYMLIYSVNAICLICSHHFLSDIEYDAPEEYANGDLDSQDDKAQTPAPEISIEWWQKELCKPEVLRLQPSTTYLRLPMLGR